MLLNQNDIDRRQQKVPLELASVLLIEADPELRSSRRLLLGALKHPVLAVSGYKDVSHLPEDGNCCLVAIGMYPSEHEAQRIANHVRRVWPTAKILLLGQPSRNFDDPLYDDAVQSLWSPSAVIEAALRLINPSYKPN